MTQRRPGLKWIKWRRARAPDLALQAAQGPPVGLFGRLYTYTYTLYDVYIIHIQI